MAEAGTAGLSVRAIARQMGMTSAALYYYYDSIDALITDLIIDAFDNMNAHLQAQAQGETALEQLIALALSYRQWALTHAVDFQLIYGNPIPGYQQPIELTYPPARHGFAFLAGLIFKAVEEDALTLPEDYTHLPPELQTSLTELRQIEGHDFPPAVLYLAASVWSRMHGMVMLELFDLIQPVIGDSAIFYRHEITLLLEQFST